MKHTTCKVDGCTKPGKKRNGKELFLKGLCNSHYQRQWRKDDNRRAVYYKMINRCSNPNNDSYELYGGRGIWVCDRWLPENNGFANFCEDMGKRPTTKTPGGKYLYTLDRIDSDGPYMPGNCRWATNHVQNNSLRDNRVRTENTFIPPQLRHRGVTVSRYKYKNGKQYKNKSSHWCASLWVDGHHIRKYVNDRETAIMVRLALEEELLGKALDD